MFLVHQWDRGPEGFRRITEIPKEKTAIPSPADKTRVERRNLAGRKGAERKNWRKMTS